MLRTWCCGWLLAVMPLTTVVGEDVGFVDLFNGKDLSGWTQRNGTATYRVEGDAIVGKTNEGSPNSFLCTDQKYGNFELKFDVKVDSALNSGVQIRSQTKPVDSSKPNAPKFGRVNGPQVEIEASNKNGAEAGYIYGEATGRGWLTPKDKLIPHKLMKDGEWNSFRVVANGPQIQTWINGEMVSDLTDEAIFETHPAGFIGLQVHGIGRGTGPYEVSWKNIRVKSLD